MDRLTGMFAHAINHHEATMQVEGGIMFELGGEAAFEPDFDEKLCSAISDFVAETADAIRTLTPRVRRARLRARVAEFVAKHRK